MENCVFCKIAKGEIPSYKIWEDEDSLAFLDLNPLKEGHAVLIPKKHTDYIFDIPDKEYQNLFLAAKRLAEILKSKLKPKKIGVQVMGFGVPHAHVHLIPLDSERDMNYMNATPATPEELKKVAEKITK